MGEGGGGLPSPLGGEWLCMRTLHACALLTVLPPLFPAPHLFHACVHVLFLFLPPDVRQGEQAGGLGWTSCLAVVPERARFWCSIVSIPWYRLLHPGGPCCVGVLVVCSFVVPCRGLWPLFVCCCRWQRTCLHRSPSSLAFLCSPSSFDTSAWRMTPPGHRCLCCKCCTSSCVMGLCC